jgi:replicative DNA helicase
MINPTSKSGVDSKIQWKRYTDIMQQGIDYITSRAKGEIRSLKTQWDGFNSIGLNGIEWQSLYVLAARPGVGKTLIASSLTRELQNLNKEQDFAVLHFQFEMLGRNLALRELSSANKMNIRYLQSSGDDGLPPLSEADVERLKVYLKTQTHRQDYVIDTPLTVVEMKKALIEFFKEIKKPFVCTLDHTLLVKQSGTETNRQMTLQNLATMLTEMKNALPVTFIVLTQLNREIDDPERQKPGNLSNFPTEADVYGSDFLLQCADVMVAYNRPAKYNLNTYGPQKFIIGPADKYLLAMHILKNRFGETGIQWYRAEYSLMTILETGTPGTATPISLRKPIS